jgi:tetratricopeptide (TPR) repeat protein
MLARALASEQRFHEALAQLDEAKLDHAAEVQVLRAGLLVELWRAEEAEAAAQAALRLSPGHPEALFHLGVIRQRAGRTAEAIEFYREALRADPEGLFVQARTNLALALQARGDREAARRELEAVLRVSPGFPPAREGLARLGPPPGAPAPGAGPAAPR